MSLSARAIALQGFGAGALLIALQGCVPVDVPAPPPAPEQHSEVSGGGKLGVSWADYLSLISEDAPVASSDDEDAIVLAACLVAVLETS